MYDKKEEPVVPEVLVKEKKRNNYTATAIREMRKDINSLKNSVKTITQTIHTLDSKISKRSFWDKFKALLN
jgi:hypothetical protein